MPSRADDPDAVWAIGKLGWASGVAVVRASCCQRWGGGGGVRRAWFASRRCGSKPEAIPLGLFVDCFFIVRVVAAFAPGGHPDEAQGVGFRVVLDMSTDDVHSDMQGGASLIDHFPAHHAGHRVRRCVLMSFGGGLMWIAMLFTPLLSEATRLVRNQQIECMLVVFPALSS